MGLACLFLTGSALAQGTPLACGDLLSGSIDASGEADFFSFTGNSGEVLDLTLTETSNWGDAFGSNDAQLTLFSPTAVEVILFDSTAQQQITLEETGTYLIRIKANNLVSAGSYNPARHLYPSCRDCQSCCPQAPLAI